MTLKDKKEYLKLLKKSNNEKRDISKCLINNLNYRLDNYNKAVKSNMYSRPYIFNRRR
jgi:hypothetical protein